MYLARTRDRRGEAWGAGRKSTQEDGAPCCGVSTLGRLLSCSQCLFITTVVACKLMCDHRRERQCNYGAYFSVCGLCGCIYLHVDPHYIVCVCVCVIVYTAEAVWWCGPYGAAEIQKGQKGEKKFGIHTPILSPKHTHKHAHIHTHF